MVSHYGPNRIIIPWPPEQGPLPFDCLYRICEFLQPKDLVSFALACREFYHVARNGSLWRVHSLHRWVLCSLIAVPEGVDRWRRYYVQRRQQEKRFGRIPKMKPHDVPSLSLHGHKDTEIIKMLFIESIDENSDGLVPINMTSYDRTGAIYAWDIQHDGRRGRYVWKGTTSKRRSAMACSANSTAMAYPSPSGDSVMFLNALTWRENKRPEIKLSTMTSASGHKVLVTSLMYGEMPGRLPKPYLMVGRGADPQCSRIEIWDVENESADKPAVMLDSVGLVPTNLQLSSNNILAACSDREYEESCSPYVKIWDLTVLPVDGSLVKEHIVIQSKRDVMNIRWWYGRRGVLAIGAVGEGALTVWELQPQIRRSSKSTKPQPISLHYTSANYTVHGFHCSEPIFPMASTTFYLLFGGSRGGELNLLPVGDNKYESLHVEHTCVITGVAATEYGVFTCSRDFSMKVFQWRKGKTPDEPPILEFLYNFFGGSVIHTGYGFGAIDYSYNSVAGISGERIKIFIFQK